MANKFDMQIKTSSKMKNWEEKLGFPANVKVKRGKGVVLVGHDNGSTQTRVTIMDSEDGMEAVKRLYVIPSIHSAIDEGDLIESKSDSLYDNMDSYITCQNLPPYNPFTSKRVLRGTKRLDGNFPINRMDSSRPKIETDAFYFNTIDSIAYGLIQKYSRTAEITKNDEMLLDEEEIFALKEKAKTAVLYEEYDVYSTISLPADETYSENDLNTMKKKMIGTFRWVNSSLDIVLKINIKAVNVTSESVAAQEGYAVLYGDEENEDDALNNSLILDGGGRNVGTGLMVNGRTIDSASRALSFGGTKLHFDLGVAIAKGENGGSISEDLIEKALQTGTLKMKRKGIVDVSEYIIATKKHMAKEIYDDAKIQIFDTNRDVKLEDVECLLLSGRLFESGSFPEEPKGYSIAEELTRLFREDLPDLEVKRIPSHMIAIANCIKSYDSFGGVFENEDEEEIIEENSEEIVTPEIDN